MAVMRDLRRRHDMQAEMTRELTFPAIARRHGVTQREVAAIYQAGEWANLPKVGLDESQAEKAGKVAQSLRAHAALVEGTEYSAVRTVMRRTALWLEHLK